MFKNNFLDHGLLLLRVGVSGMLLTHGIPKINRLFAETIEFGDPLGVGATTSLILALIGEVVAPVLLIIGYKTKLAAIPAFITMAVAGFIVHADDPFSRKEKALLFALCFLVIFLTGAGKYSIDKK